MAVYVDHAHIPASVPNGAHVHTSRWCHLMADTTDELLAFAARIGLRRTWLQRAGMPGEHFDVTAGKRRQAVALGAVEINRYEGAALMRAQREGRSFDLAAIRAEGGEPRG